MSLTEKSAYIKGLADGLEFDKETKEGKIIAALLDLVDEMANEIAGIHQDIDEIDEDLNYLNEYVEELDDDLQDVEDYLDEECCCDDDEDWDDEEWDDEDWDEDEDYEEGFDFGDEDSIIYEVKCVCGNVINFDEETLEAGSIVCDECGETLEFTFDDEDEEDAE